MLRYGGDGFYLNNENNSINFFKKIIDSINYQEIENPFYKKRYLDLNVTEIHFYHNLTVIKKELNLEKSNMLVNNRRPVNKKKHNIKIFQIYKIVQIYLKYFLFYLRSKIYICIDRLKFF